MLYQIMMNQELQHQDQRGVHMQVAQHVVKFNQHGQEGIHRMLYQIMMNQELQHQDQRGVHMQVAQHVVKFKQHGQEGTQETHLMNTGV
jgi:hypothetical protein